MRTLSADERAAPTSVIAERFGRILHTTQRLKTQLQPQSGAESEWPAVRLIGTLVRGGSMRLTALAAESGCELSTVSRQVASLVDSGYVERQPDPADGRAFLLAATGLAQARYAEQVRMREGEIARMLADWSSEDLSQLGILLTRFTDDLEKHQWRLTAHSLVPEQHSTAIDKEEDRS